MVGLEIYLDRYLVQSLNSQTFTERFPIWRVSILSSLALHNMIFEQNAVTGSSHGCFVVLCEFGFGEALFVFLPDLTKNGNKSCTQINMFVFSR